jgi:hypothetical protein
MKIHSSRCLSARKCSETTKNGKMAIFSKSNSV